MSGLLGCQKSVNQILLNGLNLSGAAFNSISDRNLSGNHKQAEQGTKIKSRFVVSGLFD